MAGGASRVETAQRVERAVTNAVTKALWVGHEEGPYPFHGPIHGPSFVRDLAAVQGWQSGESPEIDEASERLRRFERWSEDHPLMFAPITTSGASQVIPPGYRDAVSIPMTVDRPLAAACESMPITNASPFTVPAVSGTTGDNTVHAGRTEGDQPTEGSPTFGAAAVTPNGLAGKLELTRELVDSASPGGDLIALSIMREDWYRQVEARIYAALNTAQSGTITNGFVSSGAQARVSSTPATNLLNDLRKAVFAYSAIRRRKARNVVAGAAALEHLGGLLVDESGDDTALARIAGARLSGGVSDFGAGATDMRVAILGSDDVVNFESPLASFQFNEQAGPAAVVAAVWGYHAIVVARPRGVASIRFT